MRIGRYGFLVGLPDPESLYEQRLPPGMTEKRCSSNCTASSIALTSGSGALISSSFTEIPAGTHLDIGGGNIVLQTSFSARAGDVLLIWGWVRVCPDLPGTVMTSLTLRYFIDSLATFVDAQVVDGPPGLSMCLVANLPARWLVTSTGTHTLIVHAETTGVDGETADGGVVIGLYRSPPL